MLITMFMVMITMIMIMMFIIMMSSQLLSSCGCGCARCRPDIVAAVRLHHPAEMDGTGERPLPQATWQEEGGVCATYYLGHLGTFGTFWDILEHLGHLGTFGSSWDILEHLGHFRTFGTFWDTVDSVHWTQSVKTRQAQQPCE